MKRRTLLNQVLIAAGLAVPAPTLALEQAKTLEESSLQMMRRPLITGASVSADYRTASPGKRLVLRYTERPNVRMVAFGGRPGAEVLKQVSRQTLKDRTLVIGIDLFFWDSTLGSPESSIQALKRLISQAVDLNIPLVLGEIPELLPGMQPSRVELNGAIHRLCQAERACYVLPLDQLHRKAVSDGYLEIHGRKLSLKELVPDGLHLSEPAGEYLADRILALLRSRG